MVGQVSDGDEVAQAVEMHHPDVVLMDLVIRRVGGIEAISALQRRTDAVRHLAALTDRERDVAAWAGELTNDQIAARVHLSASTVKQHLSSALAKLGLSTRAELAVLVDRAGLTEQR